MTFIPAAQVIYTNVETDQSPKGIRGQQTIFYSQQYIQPDELSHDIEPRLIYAPREGDPTKHVFFLLQDGRVVVAQIVSLSGADQFHRLGRYFAHALIFLKSDFEYFDNNPFVVFSSFTFMKSVEEAMASGERATGNIGRADVPLLDIEGSEGACGVARDQLFKLSQLACRASELTAQNIGIGFSGPPDKMFEALQTLFDLIPRGLRVTCSFDTFFIGGNLNKTPFWGIGLPESERLDHNLIPFHLGTSRFTEPSEPRPDSAYETWLQWALSPPIRDIARFVESAYVLGRVLEGRGINGPLPEKISPFLMPAFQPFLQARLVKVLRPYGELLSRRVLTSAMLWASRQNPAMLRHESIGITDELLEQWLVEAYEQFSQKPQLEELQELQRYLQRKPGSIIRLFYLRWTESWTELKLSLRSPDPQIFRRFSKWVVATSSIRLEGIIDTENHTIIGMKIVAEMEDAKSQQLLSILLGNEPALPQKAEGVDEIVRHIPGASGFASRAERPSLSHNQRLGIMFSLLLGGTE